MNQARIACVVAEGVILDRQKQEIDRRIKKIKKQLIGAASSNPDMHLPTEGGGSSVVFKGADGCIARITFPGPSLKGSIAGRGKTIEKIRKAAGDSFSKLFNHVPAYKPAPDFRANAERLLGRSARTLIRLCEKDSSTSVSFETAERTQGGTT